MLQEQPQESNHPVANRLALLDTKQSEHTSYDFVVELFFVKVLLHLLLVLLPSFLARLWGFEAAGLLDLS